MEVNRSERGATAIVVAIAMLVILGFAALVIDLGAGFNERAQDQAAADTGVLAGAVSFVTAEGTVLDAVIPSIRQVVQSTVGTALTDNDWRNCVDPDHLATTEGDLRGESALYQCVSFGPNRDGIAYGSIRVRVPTQDIATTFGKTLGRAFLSVSAGAESQMLGTVGGAGTFPSGVGSDAAVGSTHCYKTGSGSHSDERDCGGSSQGNFGTFLPYFYTDVPGSEDSTCKSGEAKAGMAYLYGAGLDHFLFPYPVNPDDDSTKEILSGGDCKASPGPLNPNTVDISAGNQPSDITNGIVLGESGKYQFDGRLAVSSSDAEIFKEPIDNQPLWKFIDSNVVSDLPDTPGPIKQAKDACLLAASDPTGSSDPNEVDAWHADLVNCLTKWSTAFGDGKHLFTADIMDVPRLVIAPVFWETTTEIDGLPNSAQLHIMTFAPLYLDGLWVKNGGKTTCTGVDIASKYCLHLPGMDGSIDQKGNPAISSGSAIVLSCGLLPPDTSTEPAQDRCKRVGIDSGNETAAEFITIQLTK